MKQVTGFCRISHNIRLMQKLINNSILFLNEKKSIEMKEFKPFDNNGFKNFLGEDCHEKYDYAFIFYEKNENKPIFTLFFNYLKKTRDKYRIHLKIYFPYDTSIKISQSNYKPVDTDIKVSQSNYKTEDFNLILCAINKLLIQDSQYEDKIIDLNNFNQFLMQKFMGDDYAKSIIEKINSKNDEIKNKIIENNEQQDLLFSQRQINKSDINDINDKIVKLTNENVSKLARIEELKTARNKYFEKINKLNYELLQLEDENIKELEILTNLKKCKEEKDNKISSKIEKIERDSKKLSSQVIK